MATLTSNSLDGCTSIPCFLPGSTRMTFSNTSAPVSWTKDVASHDNKALRLVTGILVPGPASPVALDFSTCFGTDRQVSGTITSNNSNISPTTSTDTASLSPNVTGSTDIFPAGIGNESTDLNTIASHDHGNVQRATIGQQQNATGNTGPVGIVRSAVEQVQTALTNPIVTSHNHTFPSSASHNHPITSTGHNHPITNFGPHSHQFTAPTQNFAVSYADVIVCVKDTDPVACSI